MGLLVPEISEAFFVPLLRGIEQAASQAGYSLLIHTTSCGAETQPFRHPWGTQHRRAAGLL